MKKENLIKSCMAFAIILTAVGIASAVPSSSPGAIASCTPTVVINHSGNYLVTNNLVAASGDCIEINASNVHLNLGGHTLTGSGPIGGGVAIAKNASHVIVYNGTIRNFGTGVDDDGSHAFITHVTASDNIGIGIHLYKTRGSRAIGNHIGGNGRFGLYLEDAKHSIVRNNTISDTGIYGIWIQDGSSFNMIHKNIVTGSGLAGIFVGCSNSANTTDRSCNASLRNRIVNNTLASNGDYGIALALGSRMNHILNNSAAGDRIFDLFDANPSCGANLWRNNIGTRNQACIH